MHTTKLIHGVRWSLALLLALGVWLLMQPLTARAETIPVTSTLDSGVGTLRQAIADAASGATITFDASMSGLTVTLTSTLPITKNLTIDGSGLTVPVTLDGNNAVRIFKVTNNAYFTLADVSLTRGRDPSTECDSPTDYAPEWVSCGGGMKIEPGSIVTATGITVQQSHAYMGGGIYNAGTLLIRNSTIISNTSGEGGGIHNTSYSSGIGALTVQTCTISGNTADAASLDDSEEAGLNTGGGGIYDYDGNVTVQDSTLSGNVTTLPSSGGGLHIQWGAVLIQNSTLSGNSAFDAGGIYNYYAIVTLHNSTLVGNTSSWHSGGIHAFCGTLHYQNTLIANNAGGDCGYTFSGPIGTNINNWVKDGSCSAAFSGDPLVGPLADNGGETLTHALLPGSPAIDAGDPASCPDTDQRGITRPQVGGCDIGAFESQGFTLTYGGGSDQSTLINTAFATPLTLTVSSSAGEPVDGGQVIFIGPASGAGLSSSPLTATISGGTASQVVAANTNLDSYVVIATTRGSLDTISYSLTNAVPEIAVMGNGQVIADGDVSPSTADHTDFGSVDLGQTLTRTFTISNSGAGNLSLNGTSAVSLSGADAFSVVAQPATTIGPKATTTFQIRFTPSVTATQVATVTIANNDGDEALYDFAIQGTGIDHLTIYLPLVYKAYTAASNLEVGRLTVPANNIKVVIKDVVTIP